MSDSDPFGATAGPADLHGAVPAGRGRWQLGLWAPQAQRVEVETGGRRQGLQKQADGFHRGLVAAAAGDDYWLHVDGTRIPDPASRWQREDVYGPSRFARLRPPPTWAGRPWDEAVVYELHVGTFTDAGTFAAAAQRLPELAELGITAVELMPVGAFPGHRGWGYDGVLPFAPQPDYGAPGDLAAFIARAHAVGMMVLVDVIYNHFGPEGAVIHGAAPDFFDYTRQSPWGDRIDYARPAVRGFFIQNALMWLRDYGADGLRLDATHQVQDDSDPHVLSELAARVRAAVDRPVHLVLEDERRTVGLDRFKGYDAGWSDDYHHSIHCLLTGESDRWLKVFADDPIGHLCTTLEGGAVAHGGDEIDHDARSRPTTAFVYANQTHDQIGNRPAGDRLIALAGDPALRIAMALLLTAPFTPLLFMGEEVGATQPFPFFADLSEGLAPLVREGRKREFGIHGDEVPDPMALATFASARPYPADPARAAEWRGLVAQALALRAGRVVPLRRSGRAGPPSAHPTGPRSLTAAWHYAAGSYRVTASFGAVPERPVALADPVWNLGAPADPFHFAIAFDA